MNASKNQTTAEASPKKTKLAVLGGGPSAMSALYHITSDPTTRQQYDITVYQMGWRLGGKGASGRAHADGVSPAGPAHPGRIEEHGLHVLFGFYDNFFRLIKSCYKELHRPESHPLSTWKEAFKPHNFGVVTELFQGRWRYWALEFPDNGSEPGTGGAWDTKADYVRMWVEALIELIFGWRALHKLIDHKTLFNQHLEENHEKRLTDPLVNLAMRFLEFPLNKVKSLDHLEKRSKKLLWIIKWFRILLWPIVRCWSQASLTSHRFWLGCDFIMAAITGVLKDKVYEEGGFNSIDEYDFREWLTMHGMHKITAPSPYCRTIYDAAFSYEKGEPNKQRIAAGAALRALFRMGFTYKGSAYYKMQAGMGDTVFTPFYEVLKRRGVKFKFFHQVEALHLSKSAPDSDDKRSVAAISMLQQAELSSGDPTAYDPLLTVCDLECWPAEPLWNQLEHADQLRGHDLESYYDHLPDKITRRLTLEEGVDYDQILFAIPIGAVPYICEELVDDSERWKRMVKSVKSVQTLSVQLWFTKNLEGLGWKLPSPLLSLYVEPLNTWADMSQVIGRENWPEDLKPLDISYYTGAQPCDDFAPDPRKPQNANFEKDEYLKAKEKGIDYCQNGSLTHLMPKSSDPSNPDLVNWDLLLDPMNGAGEQRFDSQYWRSNCGPSERCTLALPGATKHRMKADETGYSNLVICGDWIDNGLYVACMEGAFISGIYGARAITGCDYLIIGEELNRK